MGVTRERGDSGLDSTFLFKLDLHSARFLFVLSMTFRNRERLHELKRAEPSPHGCARQY